MAYTDLICISVLVVFKMCTATWSVCTRPPLACERLYEPCLTPGLPCSVPTNCHIPNDCLRMCEDSNGAPPLCIDATIPREDIKYSK